MKRVILCFVVLISISLFGQKKLNTVKSSITTGIQLPENSQQDSRMLSTAAAKALLEMESKKFNVVIDKVEVLIVPPVKISGFTKENFIGLLAQNGWQIQPLENDDEYAWLQKGNQHVMSYFSSNNKEVSIYFGLSKTPPVVIHTHSHNHHTQKQVIPAAQKDEAIHKTENARNRQKSDYTFDTTNWDDGWVSTIAQDRVIVRKNQTKVYLYFPIELDDVIRVSGRDYFWDNFIVREFRVKSKQYQDGGEVLSNLKPPYIEGDAIDPETGRPCFLAYYAQIVSGVLVPVLVVAPDERTLRNQFPKANDLYKSDISAMSGYNKFSVSLNDIAGDWTGGTSAAMNYYSVYSGNYLGMGAAVSGDEFQFNINGTYWSKHSGATGMVGNMNTYQNEYKGKVTVTNWEITLTNRNDGKTSHYYAYYEAVRGGRILHLQDKKYSGMMYHLFRK